MINRGSHIPLYIQVAKDIENKIKTGEYKPGDKINTVNELVKIYKVSRVTIVQALDNLVENNIIISRQGKGSYVKIHKHTEDLNKLRSFQEINELEKEDVAQQILSFKIIERPLYLESIFIQDAKLLEIKRLHTKENIPLAYIEIYLPESIGLKLSIGEVQNKSLYNVLATHSIEIIKAIQKIEAKPAESNIAEVLQIKKESPVLTVERTSHDIKNQNIMFSRFYYRHDAYSFIAHMNR